MVSGLFSVANQIDLIPKPDLLSNLGIMSNIFKKKALALFLFGGTI